MCLRIYLYGSIHPVSPLRIPPPFGHFKINVDGSFTSANLAGGLGGVIHDEHDNKKIGYHQQLQSFNATSLELFALLKGIELAYHHQLIPLAIETDSITPSENDYDIKYNSNTNIGISFETNEKRKGRKSCAS